MQNEESGGMVLEGVQQIKYGARQDACTTIHGEGDVAYELAAHRTLTV